MNLIKRCSAGEVNYWHCIGIALSIVFVGMIAPMYSCASVENDADKKVEEDIIEQFEKEKNEYKLKYETVVDQIQGAVDAPEYDLAPISQREVFKKIMENSNIRMQIMPQPFIPKKIYLPPKLPKLPPTVPRVTSHHPKLPRKPVVVPPHTVAMPQHLRRPQVKPYVPPLPKHPKTRRKNQGVIR